VPRRIIQRSVTWINDNAAAIQAIGSVVGIFIAIGVPWWQTGAARRDQTAARRGAARVLAMELLPAVEAIHEDLAHALEHGWNAPNHLNVHIWQQRRIAEPDVLERALHRLAVLDQNTIGPILGMLSAVRNYHRLQSLTDMGQLTNAALTGELAQRRNWLEDACRHAAEAVERLGEAARV
jgi:hypothetical protein